MITKFKIFEHHDDPYGEEIWEDIVYELEVGDIIRNSDQYEVFGKIVSIDGDEITLGNDDEGIWKVDKYEIFNWLTAGECKLEKSNIENDN